MNVLEKVYAPFRQYKREFGDCPIPQSEKQGDRQGSDRQEGATREDSDSSRTLRNSEQDIGDGNNNRAKQEQQKSEEEKYTVSFDNTPEANPRNWNKWKKAKLTMDVTLLALQLTFASAISSTATMGQQQSLGIGEEISQLGTAVFLFAFGLGGIPFAPISEAIGRQPVYVVTLFISSAFEIGAATASHSWTLIICRFFAGFFGATPLSCAGGSLVDIFDNVDRAYAFPVFAAAGFLGPAGAPVIGGYLAQEVSWRWNYHITYITGFALAIYCFLFTPETLADEILRKKAAYLRKRTGDNRWRAPKEQVPLKHIYKESITRVIKLLATEPLVQFNTAYLTVVYFCLFGYLEAYPVIFGEYHGFDNGKVGLAFIPICVGILLCGLAMMPFARIYEKRSGPDRKAPPETHLLGMIFGGFFVPIALFWIGWTSYRSVSVWAPLMSGVLFGFGILFIFIAVYQNTIDSYGPLASSALGALVLVRYTVSAGAVMAIGPMFRKMHPWWAATLLALVMAALVPVAVAFYIFGPKLRKRSPYAIKQWT